MRIFLTFLLSVALNQAVFGGEVSSEEEHSFPVKATSSVILNSDDGDIHLEAWDKEEVHLKIIKRVWHPDRERAQQLLDELEIDISHTTGRLRIIEKDLEHSRNFRFSDLFNPDAWDGLGYEVDYELMVPAEVDLRIEHDEGRIEITGLRGQLRLALDEGTLLLNDLETSETDIRADEVDIEANNISGTSMMYIRMDEGRVRVRKSRFQRLDIRGDESDILLENITLTECDIETDEGDVEADFEILSEGDCRVQSEDGDILLTFSDRANLKFSGETHEGRIRSDFKAAVERRRNDGERVDFTLGTAQARVEVYNHEGDIILRKR